ncbi:helix-turn-helix transcriptional regulator [Consotaella salsifontis]|uniref:Transcriptional regulator, AraC family n=1 Tax=Consotaella salsifontis TaxID=1365950 RepID=A0A1T4S7H5_9HYPH|nr:AraC family transcriptional regulator [Consotaella salsifontis]SKA24016.1 transcriptional regulator, AraC family [Consotaella salsifontis]
MPASAEGALRRSLRVTRIVNSYYSGLDNRTNPFNYRLLRAGWIMAGADYRIERASVPGHEFIFCLEGAGYVRIAATLARVEAGQLVWLPVERPHAHYPDPANPWDILWLRIESPNLGRLATVLSVDSDPVFRFATPDDVRRLFEEALGQIQQHSLVAAAATERTAAGLMERLIDSRSTRALEPAVAGHRGLAGLMQEMHLHYNDVWTTERFAETCRVSKSHLFRLFKLAFGQTPNAWLRGYRIAQAKRLLVETDESIGVIARRVGYEDPLYFSRDFKRVVGLPPSRFRDLER